MLERKCNESAHPGDIIRQIPSKHWLYPYCFTSYNPCSDQQHLVIIPVVGSLVGYLPVISLTTSGLLWLGSLLFEISVPMHSCHSWLWPQRSFLGVGPVVQASGDYPGWLMAIASSSCFYNPAFFSHLLRFTRTTSTKADWQLGDDR